MSKTFKGISICKIITYIACALAKMFYCIASQSGASSRAQGHAFSLSHILTSPELWGTFCSPPFSISIKDVVETLENSSLFIHSFCMSNFALKLLKAVSQSDWAVRQCQYFVHKAFKVWLAIFSVGWIWICWKACRTHFSGLSFEEGCCRIWF